MPSSGFHAYQVYTKYTDIHAGKTHMRIKIFIYFFCFMYMNVLTVCLYLCCMSAWKPERAMELLELLSQTVVNCHLHTRNWSLILCVGMRCAELMSLFGIFPKELILKISTRSLNWSFRRDYFVCGLLLCVDYFVCGIMMLHVALTGLRQNLEFQNRPGSQVKVINW